jgi:hypothetical protein
MMNETFQIPNASEICEKFPCKPEVKSLAAEYPKPSDFITKLRQEKMSVDAVQALARSMPKDKAVEWASQSARMAGEKTGLSPEELVALEATEAWIASPDVANTAAAAASAAADLPAESPACWAANAAAFTEGVEVPEEAAIPETGDDLTGHFSANSVLLSAVQMSPEGIPETFEAPEPPALAEALPTDDLIAEGVDQLVESPQPPEMTPKQQAQTAKYLEPFIELGIKLAQTVPGWL